MKSHADCFAELWELAQTELAGATAFSSSRVGTVRYEQSAARAAEQGRYAWNEGFPSIRIFVPVTPLDPEKPDLSRAVLDAATLAHELGHFVVDRDCTRTASAHERVQANQQTPEDVAAIVAEERQAWASGETWLRRVGCTDFTAFLAERDRAVTTYERGLQFQGQQHVGHASAISDTSPAAQRRYDAALQEAGPTARVRRAFKLSQQLRGLTMAEVERQLPQASREEIQIEFLRRMYGDVVAQRFAKRRQA